MKKYVFYQIQDGCADMPSSLDENDEVISSFEQICGFRYVVGVIDCTHIKIKKVPGE